MIKILFVCHGNICRSTMAEYVMKDLVKKAGLEHNFYITSAGTSTEELGNPVHHGTRKKLREEGIYCGDHRAVQLQKSDLTDFDYLVAMDTANLKNMYRMLGDSPKISRLLDYTDHPRDIADPWYTGNFDVTFTDISRGCRALLESILTAEKAK